LDYIQWIRSCVGHRKILITFAAVVLLDEHGRILLQHRADFGIWGLPGGALEFGETIVECAHRELLEETGLKSRAFDLTGVYTDPKYDVIYPNGDQVQQFTICLRGQIIAGDGQPDGVEATEQRFFDPSKIPFDGMPIWYVDMIHDALNGGSTSFSLAKAGNEIISQIEDIRPNIGNHLYIGTGASGITVREDGRVLMVCRVDNGQWTFPAGYMNIGENVANAAVRETLEETGVIVEPKHILGVYSNPTPWTYPNGDQIQFMTVMFKMHRVGGSLRADGIETSDVTWMTPKEILALDVNPILNKVHQTVLEHLDNGIFIA
jgi:ADP-ribose pyrophosphatase YjhB (NUDIX family)